MTAILIVYLVLAGLALVQSALMLWAGWEHRRFAYSRARSGPAATPSRPPVTVIAACKGLDLGWEHNLRALFEQDYAASDGCSPDCVPGYELLFVVESESDPAHATIGRLAEQYPDVPARLAVAGQASGRSQKVHNLLAAAEELSPETQVLVFVDCDARPPRHWLRSLVHRLEKPGVGAVTGYRWLTPARATLANQLLVCLNAAVGGLLGPHRHNVIWGGSWAIRRATFEQAAIRRAWKQALSDDLAATQAVRGAGLAVAFEPHCWLASPVDATWPQLWEFARRQYLLVRFHMPGQWLLVLGAAVLRASVFWGGAVWSVLGLAGVIPWSWATAAATLSLYAGMAFRAYLRHDAVRPFVPEWRERLSASARLDILAAPLVALAEAVILLASASGRRFQWRGIGYRIRRDGVIQVHHPQSAKPAPHTRRRSRKTAHPS